MATTDKIFKEFKEIIKRIGNDELRDNLSKVVQSSMHKHIEDDNTIIKLKENMDAQTKLFTENLEKLEKNKCPHH